MMNPWIFKDAPILQSTISSTPTIPNKHHQINLIFKKSKIFKMKGVAFLIFTLALVVVMSSEGQAGLTRGTRGGNSDNSNGGTRGGNGYDGTRGGNGYDGTRGGNGYGGTRGGNTDDRYGGSRGGNGNGGRPEFGGDNQPTHCLYDRDCQRNGGIRVCDNRRCQNPVSRVG